MCEYFDEHELFFETNENCFSPDLSESSPNVKGRLKNSIQFWQQIGANPEIIDVLKHGYKLPLIDTPERSFSNNNKSAIDNLEFVENSIAELLLKKCIIETPFMPHVVNPLSVSENNEGEKRLILDLRKVNLHIFKESFSFED